MRLDDEFRPIPRHHDGRVWMQELAKRHLGRVAKALRRRFVGGEVDDVLGEGEDVEAPGLVIDLLAGTIEQQDARRIGRRQETAAAGEVLDATLAASEGQARAMWRLREEHAEAQKRAGASIKNDVSVPVSLVPEFLRAAPAACAALMPGIRVVAFGHLGDGNIHFNLRPPEGMAEADFLARDHQVMDAVNGVVRLLGGSFSAEHGVGRLKTYMMPEWRGGVELDLMRALKAAFDPEGVMNPGKVLP